MDVGSNHQQVQEDYFSGVPQEWKEFFMDRIMKSGSVLFPHEPQSVSLGGNMYASAHATQEDDDVFQICVESHEKDMRNINNTVNKMWNFLDAQTDSVQKDASVYCVCKSDKAQAVVVVTNCCLTVSTCAVDVNKTRRTWKAVMRSKVYDQRAEKVAEQIANAIAWLGGGNLRWNVLPGPLARANPKEKFRKPKFTTKRNSEKGELLYGVFEIVKRGVERMNNDEDEADSPKSSSCRLSCQLCGKLVL